MGSGDALAGVPTPPSPCPALCPSGLSLLSVLAIPPPPHQLTVGDTRRCVGATAEARSICVPYTQTAPRQCSGGRGCPSWVRQPRRQGSGPGVTCQCRNLSFVRGLLAGPGVLGRRRRGRNRFLGWRVREGRKEVSERMREGFSLVESEQQSPLAFGGFGQSKPRGLFLL